MFILYQNKRFLSRLFLKKEREIPPSSLSFYTVSPSAVPASLPMDSNPAAE